jgi:UDP-N-acetylmuramate dehydrogenase
MSFTTAQRQELASCVGGKILWDCPLAPYTSFGIGGPAAALVDIQNHTECAALLMCCEKNAIPWQVVGRGTNLLVADEGFGGVVLFFGKRMSQISLVQVEGAGLSGVMVEAGCSLSRVVSFYTEHNFSGLEFAVGIPGTVGGAVVMNAGACGGELAHRLVSIEVFSLAGGREKLWREQLDFSYRHWKDQGIGNKRRIVLAAELSISPGVREGIENRCRENLQKRKRSQPKGVKSGGSFFKNPPGDSAGRLIDAAGLKGRRCGGAMISEKHANFLVNAGGATAADVLRLMEQVTAEVEGHSGVQLIPEVHVLKGDSQ